MEYACCRNCAFSLKLKKMVLNLFCTIEEPKKVKPSFVCINWRPSATIQKGAQDGQVNDHSV